MKKKQKIFLFALLILVLVAGLTFYSVSKSSNSEIKYPASSSTPKIQGSSTNNTNTTNSTGSVIDNSKNLEDCLRRVNNSDAQQTIIDQSIQDCHNKYQ